MAIDVGSPKAGPGFWLYDSKGNDRVNTAVNKEGSPRPDQRERQNAGMLLVCSRCRPHLGLLDGDGRPRSMQIGEGGGGMVDISNPLGKRVVSIQADKKNCGNVMVSDYNGEPKQFLTAD